MRAGLSDAVVSALRGLPAGELSAGRPVWLEVRSDSMRPTLRPGDMLDVRPRGNVLPCCGDVAVFQDEGGELVAHRVCGLRQSDGETWVLTRGDNARYADPAVRLSDVLGIAAGAERRGRRVSLEKQPVKSFDASLLQATFGISAPLVARFEAKGWGAVFRAAEREGLAGLIGGAMESGASAGLRIPEEARPLFGKARRVAAMRNAVALEAVAAVVEALRPAPAILLKGAFLAAHVYSSPSMRIFSDIDVLVPADSVGEAVARLGGLGYAPEAGAAPERVLQSAFLNSVMLSQPAQGAGLPVHLHWHLFNSIRGEYAAAELDMQDVWRRARQLPDGAFAPCPEHLVSHLAEHAARHSFERLIWLRDIAEAVLHYGPALDWRLLTEHCQRTGLWGPVYHALFLASRMAPIHIPETVIAELRPKPERPAERVCRRLAAAGWRVPEMSVFIFRTRPSGLLFPSRQAMACAAGKATAEVGCRDYAARWRRGLQRICAVACAALRPGRQSLEEND